MIDISKIKPGDKITVELIVSKKQESRSIFLAYPGCEPSFTYQVRDGHIVSHTPKLTELKVGNKFYVTRCEHTVYEIIAITDDYVVCNSNSAFYKVPTSYPKTVIIEQINNGDIVEV